MKDAEAVFQLSLLPPILDHEKIKECKAQSLWPENTGKKLYEKHKES